MDYILIMLKISLSECLFLIKKKRIATGVKLLMHHTSGGRIKFATSSPYIAVIIELSGVHSMNHMPSTGHSGTDVYVAKRGNKDYKYIQTFFPANSSCDTVYTGFCQFGPVDEYKERKILLNLPLYNGVNSIKIGIKKGFSLFSPVPYKIDKPVYYYGSSITQGDVHQDPVIPIRHIFQDGLIVIFIILDFQETLRENLKWQSI